MASSDDGGDIFDIIKRGKRTRAGSKTPVRKVLSPVNFTDSSDDDRPIRTRNKPAASTPHIINYKNKRLLAKFKKCRVRLPKDENGKLLLKVHQEWLKKRKRNPKSNSKNTPSKTPVKLPIRKVFVRLPNLKNMKKAALMHSKNMKNNKVYPKSPAKPKKPVYSSSTASSPSPPPAKRSKLKQQKLLHATPGLIRKFGLDFFSAYIYIERCNLLKLQAVNRYRKRSPVQKRKSHNRSVRFDETVEILGYSSDESSDPTPVFITHAITSPEKPAATGKGRTKKRSTNGVLKPAAVLTAAAKKNYKPNEAKIPQIDLEEDDDEVEYIVPTEFSHTLALLSARTEEESTNDSELISADKEKNLPSTSFATIENNENSEGILDTAELGTTNSEKPNEENVATVAKTTTDTNKETTTEKLSTDDETDDMEKLEVVNDPQTVHLSDEENIKKSAENDKADNVPAEGESKKVDENGREEETPDIEKQLEEMSRDDMDKPTDLTVENVEGNGEKSNSVSPDEVENFADECESNSMEHNSVDDLVARTVEALGRNEDGAYTPEDLHKDASFSESAAVEEPRSVPESDQNSNEDNSAENQENGEPVDAEMPLVDNGSMESTNEAENKETSTLSTCPENKDGVGVTLNRVFQSFKSRFLTPDKSPSINAEDNEASSGQVSLIDDFSNLID